MRIDPALRRYNLIATALLLTIGVGLALAVAVVFWIDYSRQREAERDYEQLKPKSSFSGEEFETPAGPITLYRKSTDDDEAVRDVRFVAMKTGATARFADDPKALIYGEGMIGTMGYLGLVKTGMRDGAPIFDAVLVRFPDLQRFKFVEGIEALDSPTVLDGTSFSAVIWDGREKARFVIFDVDRGAITHTRDLELDGSGKAAPDMKKAHDSAAAPAPRNKFSF